METTVTTEWVATAENSEVIEQTSTVKFVFQLFFVLYFKLERATAKQLKDHFKYRS